ncbi:LysM peptidoglycan-binding domain-containing protein [Candidatus Pelagibacter sp.]|uniref:LysM peptidoglycan-binding domain-containing protein n=1 Tax=Candidatus Pelagibacter sp. TaxID=2024849 RepID=UPI003F8717D6
MMIVLRFLLILFFTFFSFTVSSDPFTNEIGLVSEQTEEQVVEIEQDEIAESEAENLFDEEITEDISLTEESQQTEEITEKVVEKTQTETDADLDVVRILNVDPIVGSPLKSYILKGTALSKKNKKNNTFKRSRIKRTDQAKVPTTHTIQANETVEKIAFKYGFPLRELELANAIYPGSRKLIAGDKLVIPNRFHVVKEGQDLTTIAERYNLDPVQLASYNDMNDESVLLIGDKLQLPFFIHVTDSNETLSEIAGRYEREIDELINFNKLDENVLVLNENQLVKIPIYANSMIDYENLDKKSVNDFEIDRKNLAIVQIGSGQYLVREGDRIGNRDGVIVSIESTRMIVLENNMEFEFLINTPIVGDEFAQVTETTTGNIVEDILMTTDEEETSNEEVPTNVEDLFN